MKILITGIPGTGKTSIGKYLEFEKGFEHFDIEDILKRFGKDGIKLIEEFINKPGENKVMTWGFVPVIDASLVEHLQKLGYKMIWFDGNRNAARKQFLKRNDTPEELFDLQLSKIDQMNLDEFNSIKVNTFDDNGEFLAKEVVTGLILNNLI